MGSLTVQEGRREDQRIEKVIRMDVPVALTFDELAHPVNRIEKNLTGPVGPWLDSALRSLRPAGAGAAPSR